MLCLCNNVRIGYFTGEKQFLYLKDERFSPPLTPVSDWCEFTYHSVLNDSAGFALAEA